VFQIRDEAAATAQRRRESYTATISPLADARRMSWRSAITLTGSVFVLLRGCGTAEFVVPLSKYAAKDVNSAMRHCASAILFAIGGRSLART
jgi:hypothetical protein